MITIILLDHSLAEQNFMAEILTEQDEQNFEIISAESHTCIHDILDTIDGKYIWILPRHHKPAQSQTIKKISKLLYLQSPDIIVGHFISRLREQRIFCKQTSAQRIKDLLPSTLFYNKFFLEKLPAHTNFISLQMNAEIMARTLLYTSFPVSDSSAITMSYRFQQSAASASKTPWRFIKSAFTCVGKGLFETFESA